MENFDYNMTTADEGDIKEVVNVMGAEKRWRYGKDSTAHLAAAETGRRTRKERTCHSLEKGAGNEKTNNKT